MAKNHPLTNAAVVGRVLLSAIFLMSGLHKITAWSQTASGMKAEGMVAVPVFLAGAIVLELAGGLSVLLGFKARFGALLLIVFLIPTTLIFHDFWQYSGDQMQNQMQHFMKNLAILGGLFIVLALGAGGVSVDAKAGSRSAG